MVDRMRAAFVVSRKELHVYKLVLSVENERDQEDVGRAYDIVILPSPTIPVNYESDTHGTVPVEIVEDLVELDKIRAELRLWRPNPLKDLINLVWRVSGMDDSSHADPERNMKRVYCIGHSKHVPGF
ncbi:MAG TPA: hypothetical protein VFZ48_00225 [Candidatus Saccharimonadales bacterium]